MIQTLADIQLRRLTGSMEGRVTTTLCYVHAIQAVSAGAILDGPSDVSFLQERQIGREWYDFQTISPKFDQNGS